MPTTRITTKGQVTVPKSVRTHLGLKPGDVLEFVPDDGGFRVQKLVPVSPFTKWRGYLTELAGEDVDELIDEMRGR